MKYIDADKLLSEINARIERCEKDEEDGYPDTTSSEATLKSVRTFITSLQQEHEIVEFSFKGGTYRENGEEHAFKGGRAKVIILEINQEEDPK